MTFEGAHRPLVGEKLKIQGNTRKFTLLVSVPPCVVTWT
jgi:hypothetical protein